MSRSDGDEQEGVGEPGRLGPGAFEQLVDVHGPRVHAYLARRVGADADDLLAEVWLQAYAGRHGFDVSRGEVGAWLFGIARNVLHRHHRTRRHRVVEPGVAELVRADGPGEDWAAVDARLDAASAADGLRTALTAMPPVEREVLLLVAWEDLSPVEAAGVLGIPAGTARTRLHRARARLREHVGARSHDENQTPGKQVHA